MQPALPPPLRISYFITCSFFFPQHLWPSDIQYNLLMHHVDSLMYIIRSIKMFVSFATGVLQYACLRRLNAKPLSPRRGLRLLNLGFIAYYGSFVKQGYCSGALLVLLAV